MLIYKKHDKKGMLIIVKKQINKIAKKQLISILLYTLIVILLVSCSNARTELHNTQSDISKEINSEESSLDDNERSNGDESEGISDDADNSSDNSIESSEPAESKPSEEESDITVPEYDYMKAIWISQYDMYPVFVTDNKQRPKNSYASIVDSIVSNVKKDGFNTVFLHMRPFGDSFYESEYYPVSRLVAGKYGAGLGYDPIEIFISKANKAGLSVHAWINPMRLMTRSEIAEISDDFLLKQWYNEQSDRIVNVDNRLYLNPAYKEARKLICDGAAEIISKYNVDGIHIDDYFYPTTDANFDSISYKKSGFLSLQSFRENNINLMVSELYQRVHKTDSTCVFGVSPAGNLDNLKSTYFIDVKKWCSEDGYIDYILPQLYYGFLHGVCPFDKMVDKWADIVTNPRVKYYVGLSGGNAYSAYYGSENAWAVTKEGKAEWINNKDVLKRSYQYIFSNENVDGYSFFCYQYLYDRVTGEAVPALAEEYSNYIDIVKG